MRASLLAVVLTSVIVSGCTTIRYVTVPLPVPPELQSALTDSDLECVSDEAYAKIVLLDKRRATLRAIIKSTHNKGPTL